MHLHGVRHVQFIFLRVLKAVKKTCGGGAVLYTFRCKRLLMRLGMPACMSNVMFGLHFERPGLAVGFLSV